MALPYNPLTRTLKPQGTTAPTLKKASPLFNASKLINQQYDVAQGRLGTQSQEAARSALENAQRQAAINGTSGAGFQTKIQQDAVNESQKPFLDTQASLASDRAGALAAAGQNQATLKENQRQFDFSAGLQKYAATNQMDMDKFSTFINAVTAAKGADLTNPKAWAELFQGGYLSNTLKSGNLFSPGDKKLPVTQYAAPANIMGNARGY